MNLLNAPEKILVSGISVFISPQTLNEPRDPDFRSLTRGAAINQPNVSWETSI
jgi:hypothetical protein